MYGYVRWGPQWHWFLRPLGQDPGTPALNCPGRAVERHLGIWALRSEAQTPGAGAGRPLKQLFHGENEKLKSCTIDFSNQFDSLTTRNTQTVFFDGKKTIIYLRVIEHGSGKSLMNGSFNRKITYRWSIFRHAMFHYRRVILDNMGWISMDDSSKETRFTSWWSQRGDWNNWWKSDPETMGFRI